MPTSDFKARRKAKRKRRAARPPLPRTVEARYERALVKLTRRISKAIENALAPRLKAAAKREDAAEDSIVRDFGSLRIRVMRLVRSREVSPIVDQFGREIVKSNTITMRKLLGISLADETPAVRALLAAIRKANVELIESIAANLLDEVLEAVTEATARGTRVEVLARRLQERYRVTESRARLIARDQTLKANASLTEERHAQAGVEKYTWSSSGDARVRPIHRELNGRTFSWDSPPVTSEAGETNHPGGDYQCRCIAIPILD